MTFIDRTYPDVVRDILTNLTQGVTGEAHRVDYDPDVRPVVVPDVVLQRRPVRRVSFVRGLVPAADDSEPPVPYTFTLNDYELAGEPADPEDLSHIRFLPFGRKPAPGTDLVVNYYPRTTDPTPVTDMNVGSVARTLVEAVSRELALLWSQLNLAYDAGFVETATGASLDRVVALLDYRRFRAGRPVGSVTFSRRTGVLGSITIPAGTPVTDAADKIRYETAETREMLAGETTAQVRVRGASEGTPAVEANVLTVIQRAIAGLDKVTNERPTTQASEDESDQELRARARAALLASDKGTVATITYGLLQLPQVRDAKVIEMPNGVPGEIRVLVSLDGGVAGGPGSSMPKAVLDRIEELRPAGVRVVTESAGSVSLQVQVQLVLAGSHLSQAEIEQVRAAASKTLQAEVAKKGVGEKVRNKPLVAALLADARIADATVTLAAKGGPAGTAGADFQPEAGAALRLEPSGVVFGTETYDQEPPAGQPIPVEVRATIGVHLATGVSLDQARSILAAKLEAFFGQLAAGASVDTPALLNALRDDAHYGIDPLKLVVTLTAAEQFAQVAQGGPAFQVLPRHTFAVADTTVEIAP